MGSASQCHHTNSSHNINKTGYTRTHSKELSAHDTFREGTPSTVNFKVKVEVMIKSLRDDSVTMGLQLMSFCRDVSYRVTWKLKRCFSHKFMYCNLCKAQSLLLFWYHMASTTRSTCSRVEGDTLITVCAFGLQLWPMHFADKPLTVVYSTTTTPV